MQQWLANLTGFPRLVQPDTGLLGIDTEILTQVGWSGCRLMQSLQAPSGGNWPIRLVLQRCRKIAGPGVDRYDTPR
jgi:hypothetical protein